MKVKNTKTTKMNPEITYKREILDDDGKTIAVMTSVRTAKSENFRCLPYNHSLYKAHEEEIAEMYVKFREEVGSELPKATETTEEDEG